MAVLGNLMAEARRLESRGDVQGAVRIYRQALVRQEEAAGFADLSLHNGLGDLYLRAGLLSEALDAYERAAEQCEEQQMYANAIALCKKILRNAPEHLPAYRRVARLCALSGLEAEARLNYTRFRDGVAKLGRAGEALECLREIVDAAADEESTLGLAEALAERGEPERGLKVLREVKERRETEGRSVVHILRRIQELQREHGAKDAEVGEPPAPVGPPAGEVEDRSPGRVGPPPVRGDEPPPVELLGELPTALEELDGQERFARALDLVDHMLELRPGNVELLSRKLHYALLVGDEDGTVSAYLDLGKSLDRLLDRFSVRALSSVAADGGAIAAVQVGDSPGQAGS